MTHSLSGGRMGVPLGRKILQDYIFWRGWNPYKKSLGQLLSRKNFVKTIKIIKMRFPFGSEKSLIPNIPSPNRPH